MRHKPKLNTKWIRKNQKHNDVTIPIIIKYGSHITNTDILYVRYDIVSQNKNSKIFNLSIKLDSWFEVFQSYDT